MLDKIKREPALLSGLIGAVIALLASFGLSLSADQVGGIMAVVAAVLAFVVRSVVTPSNEVVATQRANETAIVAGPAAVQQTGSPVQVLSPGGVL